MRARTKNQGCIEKPLESTRGNKILLNFILQNAVIRPLKAAISGVRKENLAMLIERKETVNLLDTI